MKKIFFLCVWVQVSAKLLNLKGQCVDYISLCSLAHVQTVRL